MGGEFETVFQPFYSVYVIDFKLIENAKQHELDGANPLLRSEVKCIKIGIDEICGTKAFKLQLNYPIDDWQNKYVHWYNQMQRQYDIDIFFSVKMPQTRTKHNSQLDFNRSNNDTGSFSFRKIIFEVWISTAFPTAMIRMMISTHKVETHPIWTVLSIRRKFPLVWETENWISEKRTIEIETRTEYNTVQIAVSFKNFHP